MAGTITKRIANDGTASYRVRVEIPTGIDGTRKQASKTYRTRKEADRALSAWLVEIERGTAIDPSKITVVELLAKWLQDEAAHRVKPTALEDYTFTITKHLVPNLGAIPVQRLQPNQLQAFYSDRMSNGTGAPTLQLCHLRLSQALKWAMRMGIVARNVCDLVKPPTAKPKPTAIWSPAEARRFLEHAGEWAALFDLMLATGVRRGEALALTWPDVDLEAATIRVRQSVGILAGKIHLHEPKTRAAKRTIRIPDETVAMLRAHKVHQNEHRLGLGPLWEDRGIVFANAFGGYLDPNNVSRAFRRLLKLSGSPPIRIHDLRHTHASWLLMNGANLKAVSDRLGHAKASITLDTYAHVMNDSQDRVSEIAGDLLYRRSG